LHVTHGAISFEDLHFDYGRQRRPERGGVLHGIDLDIAPGERVGLVGPSGAGKSTLVNLLLHFYDTERGRILIDGQDIAGVTQESLRTQIAMVTQDTSLLHRSIRDNIRYGRPHATQAMIEDAARRAEAHEFILGLEDWHGRRGYDAHVGERGVKLSGGQRQRVALARALAGQPEVIIADEITSALDVSTQGAVLNVVRDLQRELRLSMLFISHNLAVVRYVCDTVAVMRAGRIVECGPAGQVLAAPAHDYTRELLAAVPRPGSVLTLED
jgi:ATP-binding cassette subfamily B multidrug efflux pump